MRILVAEDERDLNRLISEELEEAGYSVDRCYDGGEAMDFVDSAVYDAAVLDIMMPVKSGREVVREMRGNIDAGALPYGARRRGRPRRGA